MPRRHRLGRTRMSSPKVRLPKAKKNTLPKPQPKLLTEAYRKTVTGNTAARVAGFFEAITWWDDAVPYYLSKSPLSASDIKLYERANKVRAQAVSVGVTDGERVVFLERTALTYHQIWKDVPAVQPFLDKYKAQAVELAAKEKKLTDRFTLLLSALNGAFTPLGIEFSIHDGDGPREFDGVSKIMLSKALAKVLAEKVRKEGILPAIFSEAPMVLKALSIERDAEGNASLSLHRYFEKTPAVMSQMLTYCGTVERAKVFRAAPEELEATVGTITAGATPKPRPARPISTTPRPNLQSGPKVGGKFKAGSAMAQLYILLQDQTEKQLDDIKKQLPVGDPMGRIKALVKIGADTKLWTVKLTSKTVQMEVA